MSIVETASQIIVHFIFLLHLICLSIRTVLFVIVSSTFLAILLNWQGLWTCNGQECKDVRAMRVPHELSNFHITVLVFESVFALYWIGLFGSYVIEVGRMWSIKYFFENELKISEVSYQYMYY